jgi:hypothetical protein
MLACKAFDRSATAYSSGSRLDLDHSEFGSWRLPFVSICAATLCVPESSYVDFPNLAVAGRGLHWRRLRSDVEKECGQGTQGWAHECIRQVCRMRGFRSFASHS